MNNIVKNKVHIRKNETLDGGFLQSENWKKFQESLGKKVIVQKVFKNKFLAIKNDLPLGLKYLFIPRGPIFIKDKQNSKIILINKMVKLAKKEKVDWIKIEPQNKRDLMFIKKSIAKINENNNTSYKIIKSNKEHEPKQTLMINLRPKENKILEQFKPKTRYNIRLGKRKGIKIFETKNQKDVDLFLDLLEETAKRDNIKNHSSILFDYSLLRASDISCEP